MSFLSQIVFLLIHLLVLVCHSITILLQNTRFIPKLDMVTGFHSEWNFFFFDSLSIIPVYNSNTYSYHREDGSHGLLKVVAVSV